MKTTTAITITAIAAFALVYYSASDQTHPNPAPPPPPTNSEQQSVSSEQPPPPSPAARDSGVRGVVLLGPTCPVMRMPPDPGCNDQPYQTTIDVHAESETGVLIASARTSSAGIFQIPLNPGHYVLAPRGGQVMPRCREQDVLVMAHQFQSVNLSCDTGIR